MLCSLFLMVVLPNKCGPTVLFAVCCADAMKVLTVITDPPAVAFAGSRLA